MTLGPRPAGMRHTESGTPPAGRALQRSNSRYGASGYARSEWEEKQIMAGYQAVEELVNMTQVPPQSPQRDSGFRPQKPRTLEP